MSVVCKLRYHSIGLASIDFRILRMRVIKPFAFDIIGHQIFWPFFGQYVGQAKAATATLI